MDVKNNTLLRGGLPMSTTDFVNPDKARESKLQLLSAISHISEIHADKMKTPDNSELLNQSAMNKTIEEVNKEFKMDEYIFSDQIVRNDLPEPSGQPIMIDNPVNPVNPNDSVDFDHPEMQEFNEMDVEESQSNSNDMDDIIGQGEPMVVLSDEEVGKKKNSKKNDPNTAKSTPEERKAGRKVAWLSYILFFIPLLFMRHNSFVRHHANEGLELNIMDIFAVAFILIPRFVKSTNQWVELGFVIATIVGIVLAALSIITKLFLIIFSFAGKEASSPWFGKTKMIK